MFPAYAGVIPPVECKCLIGTCVPRVSGGDPAKDYGIPQSREYSPRMRE